MFPRVLVINVPRSSHPHSVPIWRRRCSLPAARGRERSLLSESYTTTHRVDQLLAKVCEGRDEGAFNLLVSLVYADLRTRARRRLRHEPGRALDPSDLVHEAYIRLVNQRDK